MVVIIILTYCISIGPNTFCAQADASHRFSPGVQLLLFTRLNLIFGNNSSTRGGNDEVKWKQLI